MSIDSLPDTIYDGLGPQARKVAEYFLFNPQSTYQQIADHFNISPQRVSNIINSSRFFRAIKLGSQLYLKRSVPRAAHTLVKCLESASEEVKLKSSIKILENDNVIGPERLDVTVNDLSKKSYAELEAMVREMTKVKPEAPTIDAEIIS